MRNMAIFLQILGVLVFSAVIPTEQASLSGLLNIGGLGDFIKSAISKINEASQQAADALSEDLKQMGIHNLSEVEAPFNKSFSNEEHKDGYEIKTNTSVHVASLPDGGDVAYAKTSKEITNKNNTSHVHLSAYNVNAKSNETNPEVIQEILQDLAEE